MALKSTPTRALLSCLALIVFAFACYRSPAHAAPSDERALEEVFSRTIRPFIAANCAECHADDDAEANLDLSRFSALAEVAQEYRRWETVLERLEAREMPPEEASRQPTDSERQAVIAWIRRLRTELAQRNAGDPGVVLARRLSNAEYNYTIRDLAGVDIQPTREFPVDPANEAGFDNSGESLAMSPALFQKYLAAARQVAEHLVLKPQGFAFAPHAVLSETDRDKYCVLRIVEFYRRQPTDLADYFFAAWRYRHRAVLGRPEATLNDVAAECKVSAKYLATVWSLLEETAGAVGPVAKTQAMWRALPAPRAGNSEAVWNECEAMRDWIVGLRAKLQPQFANLKLKEVGVGSQPFILWKNRQYAAHRRTYDRAILQVEGMEFAEQPQNKTAEAARHEDDDDDEDDDEDEIDRATVPDADLTVPADPTERARHEAAFERFCSVFPDVFYRSERGRMHFSPRKERQDKGRFLTAGFHNSTGYFRDDQPLCELILDENGRRELDALWQELNFIALAPQRQHADFIFYERAEPPRTIKGPEFDFIRSEDKDAASEAKIKHLAKVYLANARKSLRERGGDAEAIPAIEKFFDDVNANIRWVEQAHLSAEPSHLEALLIFAERAYRRPLDSSERDRLISFYRSLRDGGLDHENAMRDAVVSILMSPHFCYRIVPTNDDSDGVQPLADFALASRLSYFLWSSMPDEELLAAAAAGELQRPEVLVAQARRMMGDARIRGLAVEFGTNWLDIRRFEEHNAVDRDRFPSFDDELRLAMFEEPVRFFVDVVQNDRSVLDFLYARHTFVNAALAKHYGMPSKSGEPSRAEMLVLGDRSSPAQLAGPTDDWVRMDDADQYSRGGLLPMAVFLTKNSPGLRTSPVKRGYWVVRRVLGEVIPPPPAVVPELPHDEAQLGEQTLRDVLERHRSDPSCAGCHARFDSFGLVFEGFGPIGERRDKDLGGRPVDDTASFANGSAVSGLTGLRDYIRTEREDDFLDNLCRKMLAYALGRTLILSDEPLIDTMREKLAEGDYRFGSLIETIVSSRQFRTRRSNDTASFQ
jgi:mono/diheme cytochrome c family protein